MIPVPPQVRLRFGWRQSMPVPMPMSQLVADNGRRQQDGLRQLLPGFLQPPLITRGIHDTGRTAPREGRPGGNDHRQNQRTGRQTILHFVPTKLHARSIVLRILAR